MSAALEEILREIERLRREVDALRCLDQPTLTGHTHTQAQSHNSPDTDAAPTSLHHTLGAGANQSAAGNHTHTQAQSHNSADTDTATTALHHTLGGGANQAAAGNHSHTLSGLGGNLTQSRSHDSADTDGSAAALHHTLGAGANQAAAGNHTHGAAGVAYYPIANPTNVWNNVNVSDGTWDYAATAYGVPSGAAAIIVRARVLSSGAMFAIRKRYSTFDDMILQGTAGTNAEYDQGIVRLNADVFTIAVAGGWVYGWVDIVGYFK